MNKEILSVIRGEAMDIDALFASLSPSFRAHSEGVSRMTGKLLEWAAEDFPQELAVRTPPALVMRASLYHDIGFALIPVRILEKQEDLSGAEFRVVQQHSTYGGMLLDDRRKSCVGAPEEARFWEMAAEIALGHHERWDGKGYPFGLLATAIPPVVRAVSVADAYDSMVRGSCYRMMLPPEYAILEILQNAGKQFDPFFAEVLRKHHDLILKDSTLWVGGN